MAEAARKLDMVVTLTVDEFSGHVRAAVRAELALQQRPSDVMTTEEAGEMLRLDPKTVAKYANDGKLPAHRLGPEWRFRRSELLDFITKQGRTWPS